MTGLTDSPTQRGTKGGRRGRGREKEGGGGVTVDSPGFGRGEKAEMTNELPAPYLQCLSVKALWFIKLRRKKKTKRKN